MFSFLSKKITLWRQRIYNIIFDFLFPVACTVCDKQWSYLCAKHKKYLQKYHSSCYVCHRPTRYWEVCYDHVDALCDGVIIGFYYTTIIKDMIHLIKYSYAYEIADFFAQQLLYDIYTNPYLTTALEKQKLIVTYIPMHPQKEHYMRWYNQAEKLATYLASLLDVPCIWLCEKIENTKTQSSLNRFERQKITTAYQYTSTQDISHYTTVLLIDDVCTTWATLDACAKQIKIAHPHIHVRWAAIARNSL